MKTAGETAVGDLRVTLLEGPACNSVPCCMIYLPSRAMNRWRHATGRAGARFPAFELQAALWRQLVGDGAHIGLLTESARGVRYPEAIAEMMERGRRAGFQMVHLSPERPPRLSAGRLWVGARPLDFVSRIIYRRLIPVQYDAALARALLESHVGTHWDNPVDTDALRSKSTEEKMWREWEHSGGAPISRPETFIGDEITTERARMLYARGGAVTKVDDSSGGAGVRFLINYQRFGALFGELFGPREMSASRPLDQLQQMVEQLRRDGGVLQELRVLDSRSFEGRRLVYDIRVHAVKMPQGERWEIASSQSRVTTKCLRTNFHAGAGVAALVNPRNTPDAPEGPVGALMRAWSRGQDLWRPGSAL